MRISSADWESLVAEQRRAVSPWTAFWDSLNRDLSAAKSEERVHFLSSHFSKLVHGMLRGDPHPVRSSSLERELMNLYTGQYDLLFSKVEPHHLVLEAWSADRMKALVQKASSLRCHLEVEKKLQVAREAVEKGLGWEDLDPPSQLAVALLAGAITAWDKYVESMEKRAA